MKNDPDWLASLLAACDRGIARLSAVQPPPRALLRDLEQLRTSLLGELAAAERSAPDSTSS